MKLKLKDPESDELFLLTNNFDPIIQRLRGLSQDLKFGGYQYWLSHPFADEFIKTKEFSEQYAGYDNWVSGMMANIQKMNQ